LWGTLTRLALGPTQPSNKWVLGALFPEVKELGHEADHSLTLSAKVKNVWSYTSTPLHSTKCLHGMAKIQHNDHETGA